MSEERGFEVVDKRRVRPEGAPDPAPGDAGAPQTAAETAAAPEGSAPDPAALASAFDTAGILSTAFHLLHEHAWIAMGLTPSPFSGTLQRDLAEAHRAIDAAEDVAKHLEPLLDAADRADLQNALSNLRLNFVRQSTHRE